MHKHIFKALLLLIILSTTATRLIWPLLSRDNKSSQPEVASGHIDTAATTYNNASPPALLQTLVAHYRDQLTQVARVTNEDGTINAKYRAYNGHSDCQFSVSEAYDQQGQRIITQEVVYQGLGSQLPRGLQRSMLSHCQASLPHTCHFGQEEQDHVVCYKRETPHGKSVLYLDTATSCIKVRATGHADTEDAKPIRLYYKVCHGVLSGTAEGWRSITLVNKDLAGACRVEKVSGTKRSRSRSPSLPEASRRRTEEPTLTDQANEYFDSPGEEPADCWTSPQR